MRFEETKLEGVYIISLTSNSDERGSFKRTYCKDTFYKNNIFDEFVQSNLSINKSSGTLRGLHYQNHPYAESKLITCTNGSIFDVILDIRKDSPTYKQWISLILSENNNTSVYIPKGLAHGFQTLDDNTHVFYQMGANYKQSAASGIKYNDKALDIPWPINKPIISEKDLNYSDFEF